MTPEKPNFLQDYQVHKKPEALKAAKRKEIRTGEDDIVEDDSERITAYIERLAEIFDNSDEAVAQRRQEIFKEKFLYPAVLIKKENFPDSYFEYQKQLAKERGLPEPDFTKEQKEQEITKVIESQKLSLDAWLDYLTSDDCKYPNDIKYFAAQGILKVANFDTEKYVFGRRSKDTTAPFPEIDREALSIVLGALEAKHYSKDTTNYSEKLLELIDTKASFGDMYAEAMRDIDTKASKEDLLPITEGEWKVFPQGSDPQALVDSLVGKRSNLCIADIGAATRYLSTGSVEVYFSYNHAKQATIPRIAIATSKEGGLYEVRGTFNKSEDIDPFISETDILSQRVTALPNGESFLEKDRDMKELTSIYKKCFKEDRKTGEKTYLNPELTQEELSFIYEIEHSIQGFGYQRDPRIEEILATRLDKRADIAFITGYPIEQISLTREEALAGNIKFHYGNLDLGHLSSAEDLILPEIVSGDLKLYSLKSAKGLKLPKRVGFTLNLGGLESAEGLVLPDSVGFHLILNRLTSAEGLKFPERVGGRLNLYGLTSAEGLKLPESIGGDFYLSNLTSAEGLKLPESIGGDLDLRSLTSAEKDKLRKQYPKLNIL